MPCLSINPAFFLHFYLFSSIDPLICLDFYFSAPLFLSIWPSINAAFLFSIFFLNCLLINPKIMFGILSSFVSQPIPQIFFQLFLNQSRNFILLCFIFCQTVFLTWFLNQSVLFFLIVFPFCNQSSNFCVCSFSPPSVSIINSKFPYFNISASAFTYQHISISIYI